MSYWKVGWKSRRYKYGRKWIYIFVQGVQEKLCFFHNSLPPLPRRYIAVRDLQCSQRKASVQSLLLAGSFLYNQWQPSAGEGEVANFREFLEKNTIFNEHPVQCNWYISQTVPLKARTNWRRWPCREKATTSPRSATSSSSSTRARKSFASLTSSCARTFLPAPSGSSNGQGQKDLKMRIKLQMLRIQKCTKKGTKGVKEMLRFCKRSYSKDVHISLFCGKWKNKSLSF